MHQQNPLISFIILVWNSEKYLERCFDSIIRKCTEEKITFEVIVINNGSQDESKKVVQRYISNHSSIFQLIDLTSNRGTTYSRNLGLKKSRADNVCILDSDTEMGDGRLLDVLKRLKHEEGIGIVAPRLKLADGSIQNSVKRFPTMLHKLLKIPRILLGIRTKNADFYDEFPFEEERSVDTAISACWFFRRNLIQDIGLLDEKIFYAPEDLDYCIRVWKAGFSVLYYPFFTVLHHTQQVTHRKPLSKTSLSHFCGLLYYYKKHGGWFKGQKF